LTASNLVSKDCPPDSLKVVSFKELNGVYSDGYEIIAGRVFHGPYDGRKDEDRITLLTQLVPLNEVYRKVNWAGISKKYRSVEVNIISDRRAIISAYDSGEFIFARPVRGKFRNGYFCLRPKFYILPFIPVLFGYYSKRTRIGKCGNDLVVDHRLKYWGFALVAGSSERTVISSTYKIKADH
jgi:hypothetical protein